MAHLFPPLVHLHACTKPHWWGCEASVRSRSPKICWNRNKKLLWEPLKLTVRVGGSLLCSWILFPLLSPCWLFQISSQLLSCCLSNPLEASLTPQSFNFQIRCVTALENARQRPLDLLSEILHSLNPSFPSSCQSPTDYIVSFKSEQPWSFVRLGLLHCPRQHRSC